MSNQLWFDKNVFEYYHQSIVLLTIIYISIVEQMHALSCKELYVLCWQPYNNNNYIIMNVPMHVLIY